MESNLKKTRQLLIFIVMIVALFTACKTKSNNEDNTVNTDHAMDLKSAILKTKTVIEPLGTTMLTMYIDDYGKLSKQVVDMPMEIAGQHFDAQQITITKDGYVYSWENGSTVGQKTKLKKGEFDLKNNFSFKSMSDEMKKQYKVKELGTETIDGKVCNVYSMELNQFEGTYYIYKDLPLKFIMQTKEGNKVESNLVSFEENVAIPDSVFAIPNNIQFTER
ncbi:MAG: hypothetical protein H6553_08390 [Chitinophagales bacterium]|nr:hypothetical protein [Chitinophagales bacterium]